MNVTVVGLGYIGLPTAALLAQRGHRVYGYDVNAQLRRQLQNKEVATREAAVRQAVHDALDSRGLTVVERIGATDAYILCLPTPTVEGKPDLRYVEAAAAAVAGVAQPGSMIVLESTVPPGATERIFGDALAAQGKAIDEFRIAHCPERVIPGAIMRELRENARVVGGRTPQDAEMVSRLYASFCNGEIARTSLCVAEFVKIVENTFRDVNIAFANELAIFAEELGVDVWATIALANKHPRVNILQPGPGVGGHCIPVDPHFLSDANPIVTELIQAARRVNDRMPYRIARRITELVQPATGSTIALLGAAYKADVEDARESPSSRIDTLLRERGYRTAIYDPLVERFHRPLCGSLRDAVSGADALVLLTPHTVFAEIDPGEVAALMRHPRLMDTRNFFDADQWKRAGFECYTLGRPAPKRLLDAVA
ncbi:MAG: nucleotide sugar dehydrogenase [Candidatus Eremiobacteraeota bacterium]|nr:nucleotide sugar dehydrogenase [Candidatus Eremiobacteraeota bacterium]MBV9055381.1 nucleotide sugar dehydrogenase [Candidatus Eremiobacteraeota bacterium]MBV9700188.1 nucleotide sugar dehydrogenase [Candidatus Eremiobacteraeota bacterium]